MSERIKEAAAKVEKAIYRQRLASVLRGRKARAAIAKAGMLRGGSRGMAGIVAITSGRNVRGGNPRLNRAMAYLNARIKRRPKKPAPLRKAAAKTLYVYRPVVNADEIIAWARGQGFDSTLAPADLHVTLAYSKTPMNWARLTDDYRGDPSDDLNADCVRAIPVYGEGGIKERRVRGGVREVKALGDDGATVLAFQSASLTERWAEFVRIGASWDFPGYTPHVTISYRGAGLDLAKVSPYSGDIVLGEEHWEEVKADAQAQIKES